MADALDVRRNRRASVHRSVARSIGDFGVLIRDSFVPISVSSRSRSFIGDVSFASRDEVHCSTVAGSAHTVERAPHHLRAGVDRAYYNFTMLLEGTLLVMQDRREAVVGAGDLVLYDTSRPYTMVVGEGSRTATVMLPQQLIDLPSGLLSRVTAVRLPGQSGLSRITAQFVSSVSDDLAQLHGPAGGRLVRTIVDLLTTTLVDELELEAGESARAALMRRICAHIEQHLGDPELSPSSVARSQFISVRHLQAMFQEEGVTVSAWIRERRLERCRLDLLDPLRTAQPVAVIAARWGFPGPAHFSRVFKHRFGVSPREFRLNSGAG